jgi:hypothetical protein
MQICKLADGINLVLAGERSELVETVLTLSVATAIIANHAQDEWPGIVRTMARRVSEMLGDEKQVAFIRSAIHREGISEAKQ